MTKRRSIIDEYHVIQYIKLGLKRILTTKDIILFGILIVLMMLICTSYEGAGFVISLIVSFALIILVTIIGESEFINNIRFRRRFSKIHFHNKEQEYPYLISVESFPNGSFTVRFKSEGITYDDWIENKHRIENVLNITVFSMYIEERNDIISINYFPGIFDYTQTWQWSDEILSDNDKIAVGVNGIGIVEFSFNSMPHLLVGGSSGCGKSCLLKVILYQCLKKGYNVYIADFKGAVDYTKSWRKISNIITDLNEFKQVLENLYVELKERLKLLYDSECSNIDEYNQTSNDNMQRIIVTIDEFADVLSGHDKDTKARDQRIIDFITEIARKGRAVGINLIISTQRPDSIVMPSAIKNNLLYRIAGKCDDNLSRIILDTGDAATEIPTNTTGVFLDSEGNKFKGFYAVERDLNL